MPLSRLEKRLNAPRTERHVVTMTQSERENRQPSSFFLFWFRSTLPDATRTCSASDTWLARGRMVCTSKGIGFETGFEAGFVFVRGRFPFQKRNRAVAQARAVEF